MNYDLIIKNGAVIDGSGAARFNADIGIKDGIITTVGTVDGDATEVIDAKGQVVTPGFIDGHTHMDAQISWDPLGTCSVWHGITTVVMGNCGFTLAPCAAKDKHLVVRNLERAEDISGAAMEAGIDWSWETYPQYLDALEKLPKGINYSGYVGHSALRTYAMGERAFTDEANADDMAIMKKELADSIKAGAIGFSTSRTRNHQTPQGKPVASRLASWDEVKELVGVMSELDAGIFEIASEEAGRAPEAQREYQVRLRDLAVESGRPVTWGMFSARRAPDIWPPYFDLLNETAELGGTMFAQVHSRALNVLMSFESRLPFDKFPVWKEFRELSLDEQKAGLRDPAMRARLVESASATKQGTQGVGAEMRRPDYEWLLVMDTIKGPHKTVAEIAEEMHMDPVDAMIEIALQHDMKVFFRQPLFNENQDHVLEMMRHPRSVVTFSDSGAHVSQIMDSSLQTHVLAHWVREEKAFTLEEAIKMITHDTGAAWGFDDRGLIKEGMAADINVFDPDTINPLMPEVKHDLPTGARRLVQKAEGISSTIVNGVVLMRDGEHTGTYPGKLLRGPLAATL
ncbi:MAG: amidohydrolase family protein [Gammaproteobacteria bacterium]|nr:amidohydrolase family protein [Gammaproteobacteria bacterium]MBQ0840174.1 amidohydrolase family protein [Gammaproteobacteria bacterium]